jgi:hypothetical protein
MAFVELKGNNQMKGRKRARVADFSYKFKIKSIE